MLVRLAHPPCLVFPAQQLMVDPVTTPNGVAYDRMAIEEWIDDMGTDPVTEDALEIKDLKDAPHLMDRIRVYQFQRLLGKRSLV